MLSGLRPLPAVLTHRLVRQAEPATALRFYPGDRCFSGNAVGILAGIARRPRFPSQWMGRRMQTYQARPFGTGHHGHFPSGAAPL